LEKKEDVIKLKKFFKIPADAEEFYNDILQNETNNNIENDEGGVYEEDPYQIKMFDYFYCIYYFLRVNNK